MNILKNKKRGFTLIEIIVVLIILGVLAAIALPNLFSHISRSAGAEALQALGSWKTDVEACILSHSADGTQGQCNSLSYSSPNFSYTFGSPEPGVLPETPTDGSDYYSLKATANNDSGSNVYLQKYFSSGMICDGDGSFAGIC